jgi:hypothetical protein
VALIFIIHAYVPKLLRLQGSVGTLHLLDDRHDALEERVRLLETVDLGDDLLGGELLEDLGKLSRLLVTLDVLEAVGLLNGTEQSIDLLALLSELGSRADEALLARELAERSTADTLDVVLECGVGDASDDLLDVLALLLLGDAAVSLTASRTISWSSLLLRTSWM